MPGKTHRSTPPIIFQGDKDKAAYSLAEAAALLGVHPVTLRRLIKRGQIKAARVGRRVLIPQAELARLLAGQSEAGH